MLKTLFTHNYDHLYTYKKDNLVFDVFYCRNCLEQTVKERPCPLTLKRDYVENFRSVWEGKVKKKK